MSLRFQRGASNLDGILILAFIIIVIIAERGAGIPTKELLSVPTFGSSTISSGPSQGRTTDTTSGPTIRSASYSSLSLSSGNAPYEIQPYSEYITISNWGTNPIDITGWTLRNGKDKRVYSLGGQLQRFSADIAMIPQATPLLAATGRSPLQNVVLKNGERAIITTGRIGVNSPYAITSFKENACTGYLERLDDYSFQPALQTSCPDPRHEPGLENLDTQCRSFVESLSSCETPEFEPKDREGNRCENCIDGKILTSSCAAYVRQHFSYQGCLAYHAGDPKFSSGTTWRVFLGRSWEMWGTDYETIELFDKNGNLAAYVNY